MPLINFTLKKPDQVDPSGRPGNLSLSWFYLTDGALWLTFANATLYEYSDQILRHWGERSVKYPDYYIVRFIEDFTGLFPAIATPIPRSLYNVVKISPALRIFEEKLADWVEEWPDGESPESRSDEDEYDLLTTWKNARTLTSGHLKGGPRVGFFRSGNKISIVWKADAYDDNGFPYWTAGNSEIKMDYDSFIAEIEDFGSRFFPAMAAQVQLAVERDWGAMNLDKQRLVAEQGERKAAFDHSPTLLKKESTPTENWEPIERLFDEMLNR